MNILITPTKELEIKGADNPIYKINKHINPKIDVKFSPNLYKFLTYKNKYFTNIFQDPTDGQFYIGLRDENSIWMGAKLMNVFCKGSAADMFSYRTSITKKWDDVTEWFWKTYLEIGKAIYDLPNFNSIKNAA